MSTRRAALTPAATATAELRSRAAAWSTPTPSGSRSTCRGNWAAAGSSVRPSPSRGRTARADAAIYAEPGLLDLRTFDCVLLPRPKLGGVGELLLRHQHQVDGHCCAANNSITSGNALYGDFTAVYKIGKWSIGPVGYFEAQTTADTGGCNPAPGVNLCGRYRTAAAGGLIGYDFGPVDLQVWVTDSFVGQNPQVLVASTCGRASASRSGDLSNRWLRWLPRTKLATALSLGPAGNRRAFSFQRGTYRFLASAVIFFQRFHINQRTLDARIFRLAIERDRDLLLIERNLRPLRWWQRFQLKYLGDRGRAIR